LKKKARTESFDRTGNHDRSENLGKAEDFDFAWVGDMATETLTEKNPSFVLQEVHKVSYEDRPVPQFKDPENDVIVKVGWTGICGSDVHYWSHGRIGSFVLEKPMVLGHESSGTIVKVGSKVTSVKEGDRVAMEPGVPCRRCKPCKIGQYNLCPYVEFASTPPYDGTLARYYNIPADFCYKLPDHVSLEEGALVEPTAVAVHITKQGDVKPGNSVVVFGAGPVGLLCAGVAKAYGATNIVMVDIVESKLKFAQEFLGGCEIYIPDTSKTPAESAQALKRKCQNIPETGADVAIDASGAASSTQTAIHVLRRGGTFVQGGMGRDEINFPIMAVCANEITVKGSFRYGQGDYELAVGLISRGQLNVKSMISKKVKFEEAEQAFKEVKEGKVVKVLIEGPRD